MATTLTIGGSAITLSTLNTRPTSLSLRFRGYSSLTIQRRGGPLPGLPDPWLGKTVALAIGGTTYFKGNIIRVDPQYTGIGWVSTYQCLDLKYRGDLVPMTDSNTLTDTASYNLPPDDPAMILSRAGRNVGQIIQDVLQMVANATALDAAGIGGYVTLTPPTLPTTTLTDLSLLTVVPPGAAYVQGEKLINSIEAFIRFWAPNHFFWIDPNTGFMRFLDQRTFSNHTFTLGTDPVQMPSFSRSVCDCYQRVRVRGQPIAEPKLVDTKLGQLAEDFAYGALSNAAAKAAWTPADGLQNTTAVVEGTCVCTDTLNIVVDPTDPGIFWSSNFWDQTVTGHLGVLMLTKSSGTGIDLTVTRRIVSNASLTAGGTGNIVVDLAIPNTTYDKFSIYGVVNGAGLVWRKYRVVDPDIAAAMANQFTYPTPWVGASGNIAVMISYPMGSVCWSNSGSPPYNEWPSWFTQDPSSQHIYFQQPTYVTCGNHVPSNVRALLAVNTGVLEAVYPPNSGSTPVYGGTSNTVEGLTNTLTVTVGQWRDVINQTAMNAFAHDLFDSVSGTVVEGSVVYHGYYGTALTPGQAVSVTGNGYTTGWESLALPIQEVELIWNNGNLTQFTTIMSVSNRRAHFTTGQFMRPDRQVGSAIPFQGFMGPGYMSRDPITGQQVAVGTPTSGAQQTFGQDFGSVAGGVSGAFEAGNGMAGAGDRIGGAMGSVMAGLGLGGEGGQAFEFQPVGAGRNKQVSQAQQVATDERKRLADLGQQKRRQAESENMERLHPNADIDIEQHLKDIQDR